MTVGPAGSTPERWRALVAVNLAALIFGATALFGKIAASPLWIVAGRVMFAAAALALVAALRRVSLRLERRDAIRVARAAALLAFHWATFFGSVQVAGVAVATLTVSTFPLFTILLQAGLRRQWPSLWELIAGLAIVGAVALIAGPGVKVAPNAQTGALIGLASAVSFAVFSLTTQNLGRRLAPLVLSFWQCIFVALLLAPALPFVPGFQAASDWLAIAALGIIGTALTHQLFLFALARLPAAACGAAVSMEPIYAILLAVLLFGDAWSPAILVAAALIVGASWILLRAPKVEAGALHAG
ncbi:MAG: DMT family transporter [Phenylobacterium sp.]|uniref:DMT family transporter n=1 Tax=Phenylobacterium sp. TaxID=1871053 RepID=UPI00391D7134